MPVHQDAGADVRLGVDERRQPLVARDLASEVVIDVEDTCAAGQHAPESLAVLIEGDVEHRDLVARTGFDTAQQVDVPLHSRHQAGAARYRIAQLRQRAEPVGIPVEDVDAGHADLLARGPDAQFSSRSAWRGHTRTAFSHCLRRLSGISSIRMVRLSSSSTRNTSGQALTQSALASHRS